MTNSNNDYWGLVVDVNDPLKSGRIRVAVKSLFDLLDVEQIPWSEAKYYNPRTFDLPKLNQIVSVEFKHDDIHQPVWFERKGVNNFELSDDDYASSTVVINKNLADYELDGELIIDHTPTAGLRISLKRADSTSIINIRSDNSVFIQNGKTEHVVHLSDTSISLGSEDASAEPAVLGNKNEEALNKLNDFVSELIDKLSAGLDKLSMVASASPYTMTLATPISALKSQIIETQSNWYAANAEFFPTTKSEIVTLD
jgi:hypothetical protein